MNDIDIKGDCSGWRRSWKTKCAIASLLFFSIQLAAQGANANDILKGLVKSLNANGAKVAIEFKGNTVGKALAEVVGEIAETNAVVPSAPTPIGELIKAQCGDSDPSFKFALIKANAGILNESNFDGFVVTANQIIKFPPCFSKPQAQYNRVEIKPGDSLWKYWATDSAGFNWNSAYFNEVEQKNPEESLQPLSPGNELNVPVTPSRWIAFDAIQVGPARAKVLMASLEIADDDVEILAGETGDQFQHFSTVEAVQCPQDTGAGGSGGVLDILVKNKTILAANNWSPSTVIVRVIDSGLVTDPKSPVSSNSVFSAPAVAGARPDRPDDYQPLATEDIKAFRDHGTKVTMLALGGTVLRKHMPTLGYSIKIKPVRAFESKTNFVLDNQGKPVLDPITHLPQSRETSSVATETILNQISNPDADIVNLSLGRKSRIERLEEKLNNQSKSLYVVAAGNNGKDILAKSLYPASYGGKQAGRDNLITVAAVDSAKVITTFSNWSNEVVDIAANGCDVPVVGFDFDKLLPVNSAVSGTSFAAPQVTFAAALIKSLLSGLSPKQIKIRLLASSDIVPALMPKVTDGRVLNLEKAISVFYDVAEIQRADGVRIVVRGRASPVLPGSSICEDDSVPPAATLLKVRMGIGPNGEDAQSSLIYWTDANQQLNQKFCKSKAFEFQLASSEDGAQIDVKSSELIDLVFASNKVWNEGN